MPEVTVAIPHSHAYKWLQTSCWSLVAHDPGVECQFAVVDNYLAAPWSIEVVSTGPICDKFTFWRNDIPNRFHASALDYAVRRTETPYFFGMETDVRIVRGGWASWYLNYMAEANAAIAGFYWTEDPTRMYVNPSATMYRTEEVRAFDTREQEDKSPHLSYCVDGEWRSITAPGHCNGAFSANRGFGKPFGLDPGRHAPGWYEPGQMLFYWLAEHHGWKAVPNVHEYLRAGLAGGTWYGDSKDDAFAIHYWGGTSGHNLEKHKTTGESINRWVPWWLEREHAVWCETVPDELREHASGVMRSYKEQLPPEVLERAAEMNVAWYFDYEWAPRPEYGEPPEG